MNQGYIAFVNKMESVCNEYRDKVAITYLRDGGERTYTTFGSFLEGSKALGKMLDACGIKKGDRVAVITPHSPQGVLASFGLAYSNRTTVLIDASLPMDEVNRLLEFSDVRGAFTTSEIYVDLKKDITDEMPVFRLCDRENEYIRFETSVPYVRSEATVDPETDVIAVMFSSGTTAQMKGIKVTYTSVVKSAEIFIRNVKWKSEYNYLHAFPLNHIAGYATAHAFLFCGCEIAMIEKMTATKLQEALLSYEPYGFGMIPKVFETMEDKIRETLKKKGILVEKGVGFLLAFSGFLRKNFGIMIGRRMFRFITKQVFGRNIRGIGTGASLCRKSTSKFFLDLGLIWANFYALTETNVPAVSTGVFDRYPVAMAGNVKRNPEIEIKLNHPDENGVGEILIKSELLMKGYFRDDVLTAESFEEGYFKTGDYGYVDKHGNLFVTGRVKESILLPNGKKISPTDVENYYGAYVPGVSIASCGVPKEDEPFDEVHIFVQTQGLAQEVIVQAEEALHKASQGTKTLYRLDGIHRIETIPLTRVGKVKRFALREEAKNSEKYETYMEDTVLRSDVSDVEEAVRQVICEIVNRPVNIIREATVVKDLGMDSLEIFELSARLESLYGKKVMNAWGKLTTVGELIVYLEDNAQFAEDESKSDKADIKYRARTEKDVRFLKRLIGLSRCCYDLRIHGEPVFTEGQTYIFAPNHSSHLDTICLYDALQMCAGEEILHKICCMAAKELAKNRFMKKVFRAIGAVPVERKGNVFTALDVMKECIVDHKFHALIYPEGTRTRTGELGAFKYGTAKLAIETGTKVIPVCINGAYEIFPPDAKLPKGIHLRRRQRYPLEVCFGPAIDPAGMAEDEITGKIRDYIVEQKGRYDEHRN
ncbi:MAG: AMP-binding protein [Lachnospiraceae bacterium]|nr:AMP-binding protein [Lachnospiraceae bacterium]